MLKRRTQRTTRFLASIVFILSSPAYSLSLLDAYSLAINRDPTFLAAIKEKEAGDENINIGRAGLLPKVTFTYQNAPKNWQTAKQPQSNIFTGETIQTTTRKQYQSYSGSVTLTQPLFDYEAYARYKASVAQTLMSDERYRSSFMELAVRVVDAYVEVAYARDKITLAEAQKTAFKEQLTLNDRLFAAGEGTVTDVYETQARYNLAQAQAVEARDALDAAQRELELIIGLPLAQFSNTDVLRPGKFQPAPLKSTNFEEWHHLALQNNPELAALRHGVQAARYDVERNRAGFMPQVKLYSTFSESDSSSDNTVKQKYNTSSIGIQLSVPLYSGGGVAASTRQAAARYGQATYEMDAKAGAIINDLRRQFKLCISSPAKLVAYEYAVKSAMTQVDATRKSVAAGQRVNVDVLNAEQQLYSARLDLASAKYSWMKSWVALLAHSGTLNKNDIKRLAEYFTEQPTDA